MKNIRSIYILILSLLLLIHLTGCSKVNARLTIEDNEQGEEYIGDSVYCTPRFTLLLTPFDQKTAKVSDQSKPDIYMNERSIVHVFFYNQGEMPDKYPCRYKSIYRVKKNGNIAAVYNDIQVKKGNYDIYLLSSNDSLKDQVPEFDPYKGLSGYIYNQTDYLWAQIPDVNLTPEKPTQLNARMEHAGCKLRFQFSTSEDEPFEIKNIILIAPTEDECKWSLSTGIISPAKTVNSRYRLKLNKDRAETIILPLISNDPLFLLIDAANGKQNLTYRIPIRPSQGTIFQFGAQHDYQIILTGDKAIIN